MTLLIVGVNEIGRKSLGFDGQVFFGTGVTIACLQSAGQSAEQIETLNKVANGAERQRARRLRKMYGIPS